MKQSERVRIARDIHDLLGHHLTALSIHLQVASRQTKGDIKANIDQCHQLSKLLLSDVRDAVSDIRLKSKIELEATINKISQQLPKIKINTKLSKELNIDSIEVADCIIKCIQESVTNTMKHADGDTLWVELIQNGNILRLEISNNGQIPKKLIIGNGLKGMKERTSDLNGELQFELRQDLFKTTIELPVS